MNKYQQYRKENGICLDCNEMAAPGKTRCIRCLQRIAAKQKIRDEKNKETKRLYQKEWVKKHPDKVKEYRKKYYDENYRSNGEMNRAKTLWYNGRKMTMADISRETGVPYSLLHKRVKYHGMSVGEVVMMYGKRGDNK